MIIFSYFWWTKQESLRCNDASKVYRQMALNFDENGQFEQAETLYNVQCKKFKHDRRVWLNFCRFYVKNSKLDTARNVFQKALTVLPKKDRKSLSVCLSDIRAQTTWLLRPLKFYSINSFSIYYSIFFFLSFSAIYCCCCYTNAPMWRILFWSLSLSSRLCLCICVCRCRHDQQFCSIGSQVWPAGTGQDHVWHAARFLSETHRPLARLRRHAHQKRTHWKCPVSWTSFHFIPSHSISFHLISNWCIHDARARAMPVSMCHISRHTNTRRERTRAISMHRGK